MILVSRMLIQPYMYFPSLDVLFRFKQLLVYGPPREENGLLGSIVLYMLLRADTMFSKMISEFIQSSSFPLSGWKEFLAASGCRYVKALLPEQKPAEEDGKR